MKGDVHIEIGSGQFQHWPEAIQVDVRPAPGIDVVADATCLPFDSEVTKGVYCSHLLEHLSYADGLLFLKESYRIMKKGSRLEISCPDFSALCRIYLLTQNLEHRIGDLDRLASTFYGNQSHWSDFHRSGYDYDLLSHQLLKTGFSRITRLPSAERIGNLREKKARELYELRVEAFKPIRRTGKRQISTEVQGLIWGSEAEYLKANARAVASRNALINRLSKSLSDPLSVLLQLYMMRGDLQQAFPEVLAGDYGRLVEWAGNTVDDRVDQDYRRLMRYAEWYKSSPWVELARIREALARTADEKDSVQRKLGEIREALARTADEKDSVQRKLGEIREALARTADEKDSVQRKLGEIREALARTADEKDSVQRKLGEIEGSLGWQLILGYRQLLVEKLPPKSLRRRILEMLFSQTMMMARLVASRKNAAPPASHHISRKAFMALPLNKQYQIFLASDPPDQVRIPKLRLEIAKMFKKPLVSIVMPVFETDDRCLRAAIESVRCQIYENWELCIVDDSSTRQSVARTLDYYRKLDHRVKVSFLRKRSGIAQASNAAIELAMGEFVAFLDHDDQLTDQALYEVVKCVNEHPDAHIIYSDEDKIDVDDKRIDPFFKPDWSPDLFLSMNYIPHFIVYRRSLLEELGSFRAGFEGSQDYDLALRAVERTNQIYHVSKSIYSWRMTPTSTALSLSAKPTAREAAKQALAQALERRGIHGGILDGYNQWYRVKYIPKGDSLVSIIIVTHDNPNLLKTCIESVQKKTAYRNFEIVVVDHDSRKPETLDYLRSLGHRIIRFEDEFNFAKFNNSASSTARGRYLLFLNDDTEAMQADWLGEMVGILDTRNDVACVGAKLLYPDGRIQHASVVLGLGGTAGHPFRGMPNAEPGYFGLAHMIRNCSAVTAACMLVRRDVFKAVGGFDERLVVGGNDVDLCIRMRKAGYQIVYNPYAVLYHREGATRGKAFPSSDYNYFIKKLRDDIANGDPFYNKNLSTESEHACYLINPRLLGF